MALPQNLLVFDRLVDPSDINYYEIVMSQGDSEVVPEPFLELGEGTKSFTLTVLPESALAGLVIMDQDNYRTVLVDNVIKFWAQVDTSRQSDTLFDGAGIILGLVLTAQTTKNPSRTLQQTIGMRILQK